MTDPSWPSANALTVRLVAAAERAKADFAAAVAPVGLPVPLARAVLALGRPSAQRTVAEHLDCDPSYVTGLASQLERRGLVRRVSGSDRRVKLLELTDAGAAVRADLAAAIAAHATIAERLDEDQRQALAGLLDRMLGE